jgi:hypothetical protein
LYFQVRVCENVSGLTLLFGGIELGEELILSGICLHQKRRAQTENPEYVKKYPRQVLTTRYKDVKLEAYGKWLPYAIWSIY